MNKVKKFIIAFVVCAVLQCISVEACTLWVANGTMVDGGGTLVVKNRDWSASDEQYQHLALFKNNAKYNYYALVVDGKYPGIKAGINANGLVVVSATASSIPSKERRAMSRHPGVLKAILGDCGNVSDVFERRDLFVGPQFLMVADKERAAIIEIGAEGKFDIKEVVDTYDYHTNHYLASDLTYLNTLESVSSHRRYERIGQLLASADKPLKFYDFIKFSEDRVEGDDNSIFRVGSTLKKPRTMATWAVRIPPGGSPELWVRILNNNAEEEIIMLSTDSVF